MLTRPRTALGEFILLQRPLDRRENILAFGQPGSGKTHLVCAIGQELIYRGHRVLFRSCDLLVQELLVAKRDLYLPRLLKQLGRNDALIIDDIGYVQHSREEMEVLFALLAYRYERGSVMITSNLPFSKWDQIFKDPMTTAAAIDRLVHHSVVLEQLQAQVGATGQSRRPARRIRSFNSEQSDEPVEERFRPAGDEAEALSIG